MRLFQYTAWVHPKEGGDDYQVTGDIPAINIKYAKKKIKRYLSVSSALTDDFTVKEWKQK